MESNVNHESLQRHLRNLEQEMYEVIHRYIALMMKENPEKKDLSDLGELEYFLIAMDARIRHISYILEQELFGTSMERLLQMKNKAKAGNLIAKLKYDEMRKGFQDSLNAGVIFSLN